jgi:hypothetical protein
MNEHLLRRIDRLEGQVTIALAAIQALMACHPQPDRAAQVVEARLNEFVGIALADDHSDDFVNGMTNAQGLISLVP